MVEVIFKCFISLLFLFIIGRVDKLECCICKDVVEIFFVVFNIVVFFLVNWMSEVCFCVVNSLFILINVENWFEWLIK